MKKVKEYCVNTLINVEMSGCSRNYFFRSQIVCENKGGITTEVLTGEEFLLYPNLTNMPANLPDQVVTKGLGKKYYLMIMRNTENEDEYNLVELIVKLLNELEKKNSNKEQVAKDLYQVLGEYSKYNNKKYPTYTM